jgi:hypothetical protein
MLSAVPRQLSDPGDPPGFPRREKSATVSLDATTTVDYARSPPKSRSSSQKPPIDLTSTTGGTNYTSGVITRRRPLATMPTSCDRIPASRPIGDTRRSLALTIYGRRPPRTSGSSTASTRPTSSRGSGKAINNEFVQEEEVMTGGYQAEYGRALGGVIT